MIEIVLKNIRQIGTPTGDDKIYMEDSVYKRLHQDELAEKRVFVFMGHTECIDRNYITFVEAAIPVRELHFSENLPLWSSHAWNDVFREIKRAYEDSIIVGWALDIKGLSPKITSELEAIHCEHFGGAHQLLFLMDSLEEEEYFYLNKNNHLRQKDGFYIYYDSSKKETAKKQDLPEIYLELPRMKRLPPVIETVEEEKVLPMRARYRDEVNQKKSSSFAMVAVIALLLGIIGTAAYQERWQLSDFGGFIETMGRRSGIISTEEEISTEPQQEMIPIEQIPGGEVMNP